MGRTLGKRLVPEERESLCSEVERKEEESRTPVWPGALFFLLCIPWLEILLRLADRDTPFFELGLLRSVAAGAAMGLLIWVIGTAIPQKTVSRIVAGVLLFLVVALFIVERCCRDFFGAYFQVAFVTSMTDQVMGNFVGTVLTVIWDNLWFFPLTLAPFVLLIIFRRTLLPDGQSKVVLDVLIRLCAMVAVQAFAVLLCYVGGDRNYYTYDFAANSVVPRFGLVNMLRLEGQYAIFGLPEAELTFEPELPEEQPPVSDVPSSSPGDTSAEEPVDDPIEEPVEPEPEPIVYDDNVMDIDFTALAAADSGTLRSMDLYFAGQEPTKQNEYTGLFAGKNLILITAEAFSTAVIDETRTPTLYQLANQGFVFTNFYQPDWSQSTTGGEFSVMTGIIPTWVNSKTSFTSSIGKELPFALGWQFRELGYTTTAWHNNSYSYYNRHKTHPNLGYDYMGVGNGLKLDNPELWPCSDLEMMQATVDGMIEDYLAAGTPFHTYYMTVSGHCNYTFNANDMAKKNRDAVAELEGSEQVRGYIACQLELEYALEYLVNALEAAGIADDTVIALAADHYPYALSEGDEDYYNELTGGDDNPQMTSRYQNTLILWSGCMEEPVVVDAPCSAVDIVPTLSNLFGLEYDSRLLSGKDILAPDVEVGEVSTGMKIVVFADFGYGTSWVTAAGTYEAYTNEFIQNEGVEVGADYVEQVSELVQERFTYAKYLISQNYYAHVFGE